MITAPVRVTSARCASRSGWTWRCTDNRCGYADPPLPATYGSWRVALTAALAHLRWHATLRRPAP